MVSLPLLTKRGDGQVAPHSWSPSSPVFTDVVTPVFLIFAGMLIGLVYPALATKLSSYPDLYAYALMVMDFGVLPGQLVKHVVASDEPSVPVEAVSLVTGSLLSLVYLMVAPDVLVLIFTQ
jgi:hypothetical protein